MTVATDLASAGSVINWLIFRRSPAASVQKHCGCFIIQLAEGGPSQSARGVRVFVKHKLLASAVVISRTLHVNVLLMMISIIKCDLKGLVFPEALKGAAGCESSL